MAAGTDVLCMKEAEHGIQVGLVDFRDLSFAIGGAQLPLGGWLGLVIEEEVLDEAKES